jgi:hypothetical protein
MEEGKRYITEFCFNNGMPTTVIIIERLWQHYKEGVIHLSIMYYWVKEVKLWRKALLNISFPG